MKNKLKHTPGPWSNDSIYVEGPNGESIAIVDCHCEHTARLIASAPEMLECLIELYSYLKEKLKTDHDFPILLKHITLEHIIEKATGQKIEDLI